MATTDTTVEDGQDTEGGERGTSIVLYRQVHKYEAQIVKNLNPLELLPELCSVGLLDLQEDEVLLGDSVPQHEKAKFILASLQNKGPCVYQRFLDCVRETSSTHMGHAYILSLLRGEIYASEDDISESQRMKNNIYRYMSMLTSGINVDALTPLLITQGLVTDDEQQMLLQPLRTSTERVVRLLRLLDSKGPTAHSIFVRKCLGEEESHLAHQELFKMLSKNCLKRKAADDHYSSTVHVTKRAPKLLEPPPGITIEAYFEAMKTIRKCHLSGQWDEAEKLMEVCMARADNPIEMKIAVLLESCTGFITRRQDDEVLSRVKRAREMCLQITTDNSLILEGRCEWVLAKLCRYTKKNDQAMGHIKEALAIQNNCESGEDNALINYCHACILLEVMVNEFSLTRAKWARVALEYAIDYASQEDYGLDLSHPRIRLAQVCLGSSPCQPGQNQDKYSISKARISLENVKTELEPRTECIYLLTWSDLHRLDHHISEALRYAQQALDIATANHFETESVSSKIRMKLIQQQS